MTLAKIIKNKILLQILNIEICINMDLMNVLIMMWTEYFLMNVGVQLTRLLLINKLLYETVRE
jgi:hypothetical protein